MSQVSEISVRIGIIHTNNMYFGEDTDTLEGGKQNLSVFEEELEENLKLLCLRWSHLLKPMLN